MAIDLHVHPWTREFMMRNGPIMKACRFFRLDVEKLPRSIEDLLESMDSAGVATAVILGQDTHATKNSSFKNYTIPNRELARIAKESGGRLIPFAGVDPNAGAEAVKELKAALNGLGFRGLKIHSSANSVYPTDEKKMNPIYEVCQEKGAPILFHTGTTGLGDTEIKYSKPEFFDEVCQNFPDLRVVMAHFGWPWPDVAVAVALRNPNAFIDISGWRPKYIPQSLLPYMNGILQDRFLFGTDYPMLRQKEWMEDFESNLRPKLKAGVADKLLTGNAKTLLRD
ncbi:MAG TPA: amidohydrolase family protein [Nitrososphaerales archaeon]|nr:amidohydrolase family protein [Nitrososphaerales archaeon]